MSTRKGHVTLDAPLDHIPLHVRGGHIIPTQEPANNTAFRYMIICVYTLVYKIKLRYLPFIIYRWSSSGFRLNHSLKPGKLILISSSAFRPGYITIMTSDKISCFPLTAESCMHDKVKEEPPVYAKIMFSLFWLWYKKFYLINVLIAWCPVVAVVRSRWVWL